MSKTAPKKILIAEDDRFLARALSAKLKKEGFEVEALRDGEQVVPALHDKKPDMLVLDLIMPHKDGFAILEEVRSTDALKELPVVVLSNLSQASDTETTKRLGALEHIVKADTPLAKIVERIRHHLKT